MGPDTSDAAGAGKYILAIASTRQRHQSGFASLSFWVLLPPWCFSAIDWDREHPPLALSYRLHPAAVDTVGNHGTRDDSGISR